MSDIYLAKSDLTGAVYAVNGKSKTNVTEFVTQLIKIETQPLESEVARLKAEAAKYRGALEHYANEDHWSDVNDGLETVAELTWFCGDDGAVSGYTRAREALATTRGRE